MTRLQCAKGEPESYCGHDCMPTSSHLTKPRHPTYLPRTFKHHTTPKPKTRNLCAGSGRRGLVCCTAGLAPPSQLTLTPHPYTPPQPTLQAAAAARGWSAGLLDWRHPHSSPSHPILTPHPTQPNPAGSGRRRGVVTAADLASADIVLTTYDVLKRDVYHRPEGEGEGGGQRALRHRKKYEVRAASNSSFGSELLWSLNT